MVEVLPAACVLVVLVGAAALAGVEPGADDAVGLPVTSARAALAAVAASMP